MKDSYRWLLLMITGAILLLLLSLHMGMMHLPGLVAFFYQPPAGAEPVDWAAVAARAGDVSSLVIYVVFLVVALYHGLYGLWNILIEAFAGKKLEKPLGWVLTIIGIALAAYGTYTTYLAYK
ncbi:MAG: hypothetical protein ABIJ56_16105 [Pseudomonadota bacterium]